MSNIPFEDMDQIRPCHYLRPNKRCTVPRQMVFVDTESTPIPNPNDPKRTVLQFRLGVACFAVLRGRHLTRVDWLEFAEREKFWGWLIDRMRPKQATYLIAHNVGHDLTQLGFWDLLDANTFRLADDEWQNPILATASGQKKRGWHGLLCANDPPTIIQVRHGNCTLTCLDTMNYCPAPLWQLGESIGLPKMAMPDYAASDEDWTRYCRRDVEVIKEWFRRLLVWWKESDLGDFRFTTAGLAWSAYRHRFMDGETLSDRHDTPEGPMDTGRKAHGRILIHGHRAATKLERAAYYGGEVRCWRHGGVQGPVYVYDVCSLYPYVMSTYHLPCRLTDYFSGGTPGGDVLPHDDRIGIAHVLIESDTLAYPRNDKGHTHYCIGKYWTCLAGEELRLAVARGHVIAWGESAWYEGADLFSGYVDYFFGRKSAAEQKGDEAERLFSKLLSNSLAGKFGQHQSRWVDAPENEAYKRWGEWYKDASPTGVPQLWRAVAHHTQRYTKGEEPMDSFPAISACINAAGREVMRGLREMAGSANVYYQDTDCIHISDAGHDALLPLLTVHTPHLGQLALKGVYSWARYYGLKHYELDGKLTAGGIKSRAKEIGRMVYEQEEWPRLPSVLMSRPRDQIEIVKRTITLSDCHPGGTALPDGAVKPLEVYEV